MPIPNDYNAGRVDFRSIPSSSQLVDSYGNSIPPDQKGLSIVNQRRKEFNYLIESIKKLKQSSNEKSYIYKRMTDQVITNLTEALRVTWGFNPNQSDASTRSYNENSPLARLAKGKDIETKITLSLDEKRTIKIDGNKVKELQEGVKIYYRGEEVNRNSSPEKIKLLRHLYHIKYDVKIPIEEIPNKYKNFFTGYKSYLEKECYHFVIRSKTMNFFHNNNELIESGPRETVIYDSFFPKLTHHGRKEEYQHHGFREYTFSKEKKSDNSRPRMLKNHHLLKKEYEEEFRSHLKISSKNNEIYSAIVPGAFFSSLEKSEQLNAKKLYVSALRKVVDEIVKDITEKGDASIYRGFRGVLVSYKDIKSLDPIIESAGEPLIFGHAYCAGVLEGLLPGEVVTAQSTMGEPFGAIGNGALGDRAARAKDERDMRQSLGVTAAILNPLYNKHLAELVGLRLDSDFSLIADPRDNHVLPHSNHNQVVAHLGAALSSCSPSTNEAISKSSDVRHDASNTICHANRLFHGRVECNFMLNRLPF